jgi:hypothetical protein
MRSVVLGAEDRARREAGPVVRDLDLVRVRGVGLEIDQVARDDVVVLGAGLLRLGQAGALAGHGQLGMGGRRRGAWGDWPRTRRPSCCAAPARPDGKRDVLTVAGRAAFVI